MELFHGKIQYFPANSNAPHALECGNPALKDSLFARGKYCKNNFNDFASSFIVLMELTVVNQWHDILCGAHSQLDPWELGLMVLVGCSQIHTLPLALHMGRQQRDGPSEGFAGFLVPPSALPSHFSLNSHATLCQWICQRDSSACQALLHCLPHRDGDNHCQVRFFWDNFLCCRWKRGSAPARKLLVGLVSPVGDGWAVFRGICCILVPTGCCSDVEGMEHWEISLGILRQSVPVRKCCLNSAHCFFQYLCVIHLGSFLCGVLPGEE